MSPLTLRITQLILLAGAVVALAACGGGSAAPGGGGDSPVAVEIPALGEISGLPFASGVVVTGSSNVAAALKAKPDSWVAKTFNLTTDTFTTGNSRLACEYRNMAGNVVGSWALPDQALCIIKDNLASFTSPDDGNYHYMSTGATGDGIPSKIKFKVTKDSGGTITNYEEFTCDSADSQLTYVAYVIDGAAMTATLRSIRSSEPQRMQVDLTATLNASAEYTAKSGTVVYTGSNDATEFEGKVNATQGVSYLLLDGFDLRGDVIRMNGQADQSNITSPLAISGYVFGAGAANLIENDALSTECWDDSNDPTTCEGANFTAIDGQTPIAASTQTVSSFSTAEGTAWDCQGIVEVTASIDDGLTSCFSLFSLDSEYIDCTTATQGNLTVTPSVAGATLSIRSDSATSVNATSDILITGNRVVDTSSFNATTVTLVDTSEGNAVVALDYDSWDSGTTVLTLSPTLTSGHNYTLTLVGSATVADSDTVIRSPSGTPPSDQLQSTGTYYIRAQ